MEPAVPGMALGVFLAQLEDGYQTAIWKGIESRARALGWGVTCFIGPGPVAFGIAAPPALDALIILATTIDELPPNAALLPRVSLGQKLPGVPSVTTDGNPGMGELIRHLVRDHRRTQFALITGPEGHFESVAREAAVRANLAAEGLDLDPRLVVRGTFFEDSGREGTRRLLTTGLAFDALVSLNDRMAFGALQALAEGGRRVPQDVSVTGFDDIEQCRHVFPPLTTIDQPLETMGALAVDMAAEILAGEVPEDRVLPCLPVRRWSCGCPPRPEDFFGRRQSVSSAVGRNLVGLLARGEGPAFLVGLDHLLGDVRWGAAEALAFVDDLEAEAFPGRPGPDPLAEAGRRLAAEGAARFQAARHHAAVDRFAAVRNLSARIAGAFGRDTLLQRLQEGWESVGVRRGFLVLFTDPAGSRETGRVVLPEDHNPFPTKDILPARWGRPWTRGPWILEPLVYQEEPLGYLLLEGSADEPSVYSALRDQVASSLKGTILMETLKDHERSLGDQVADRTRELTRTNAELVEEVRLRRDLERQVQEISDRTMRRIGQDLHDDLCQHLAGVAMLATVVRRSLPEAAADAASSLDRIGALLEDSIIRARQIARGLYPPGLEERGLADAVEELVATARLTTTAVLLYETEGDCRGGSPDRRLQMFRIVQESLANALKHSGTDVVRVRLVREADGSLTASVTDFGPGLPPAPGGGGLGLGIMRYRAESAGLELRFEAQDPGLKVWCRWPPEEDSHG